MMACSRWATQKFRKQFNLGTNEWDPRVSVDSLIGEKVAPLPGADNIICLLVRPLALHSADKGRRLQWRGRAGSRDPSIAYLL